MNKKRTKLQWRFETSVILFLVFFGVSFAFGQPQKTIPLNDIHRIFQSKDNEKQKRSIHLIREQILEGDKGWYFLLPLAIAAQNPNREVARPALLLAAELARIFDKDFVEEEDIDPEFIEETIIQWNRIAHKKHYWADIRVGALEIVAKLDQINQTKSIQIMDYTEEQDLQIKEAVLELVHSTLTPMERKEVLANLLSTNPSHSPAQRSRFSLIAAQLLCEAITSDNKFQYSILENEAALARIRTLIIATTGPVDAKLDAARCLHFSKTKENEKTLRKFRKTLKGAQQKDLEED